MICRFSEDTKSNARHRYVDITNFSNEQYTTERDSINFKAWWTSSCRLDKPRAIHPCSKVNVALRTMHEGRPAEPLESWSNRGSRVAKCCITENQSQRAVESLCKGEWHSERRVGNRTIGKHHMVTWTSSWSKSASEIRRRAATTDV
jgi:hypothetical protein